MVILHIFILPAYNSYRQWWYKGTSPWWTEAGSVYQSVDCCQCLAGSTPDTPCCAHSALGSPPQSDAEGSHGRHCIGSLAGLTSNNNIQTDKSFNENWVHWMWFPSYSTWCLNSHPRTVFLKASHSQVLSVPKAYLFHLSWPYCTAIVSEVINLWCIVVAAAPALLLLPPPPPSTTTTLWKSVNF